MPKSPKIEYGGPVFNSPFKSLVIQGDDPDYFRRVADYIHLNPARAKLLSMSHPVLARHPWSSFPSYVGLKRKRPQWLECRRVLEGYPRVGDTVQGRERYRKEMESRAQECMKGEVEEEQELWQACRRGWYLGDEQFRSFLEEHLDGVFSSHRRSSYHGEPARRHDEREAERLLQESLVILRIDEAALKSMSQRDARKQGLAWILKCHTVMSNAWISDRLHMGSRTNIFMAVKAYEADRAKQDIAECRSRLRRTLVNI